MRASYLNQLEKLHEEIIRMSALCEEAIQLATRSLLEGDLSLREKVFSIEKEVNRKEYEIDALCLKLILHEQPVAGDLRQITAAQRMIIDLERVGDQAKNIAKFSTFIKGYIIPASIHIKDMAKESVQMLTKSIDSYIEKDLLKAYSVIESDDVVDGLLTEIRKELIKLISQDNVNNGVYLDLMMIAKYFERIGDHAENIAEWVIYSITGKQHDKRNTGKEII